MMIYERDVKNAHVQLANKCLNREDNISKSVCVVRIMILRFEHTATRWWRGFFLHSKVVIAKTDGNNRQLSSKEITIPSISSAACILLVARERKRT